MRVRTGLALVGAVALGLAPMPAARAAELSAAALARVPESLPGAQPLPATLRARLATELASRSPDTVPRTRHRREDGSPLFTNRLLLEASPYLQQHAHNPVNWYPWGDEAFAAARDLDRPVLVSIGYSTCHWCHVMEEESFDDPETAEYLNAHFIAIKVDREVRPDVDAVYMSAIHALGESGGWPLNVWVTPDRKPFFAGTYFPPQDSRGRRGFPGVLRAIHEQYSKDSQKLGEFAEQLAAVIRRRLEGVEADSSGLPDAEPLKRARSQIAERADATWGGVRGSPKFPSSLPVRFLLRYHRRSGDPEALRLASVTLEKMAAGGLYDHVGGGFHRYSTDSRWLVPHFEKMLYDNALLALAYLEAWQLTGRADFERTARDVLRYVEREMTSPEGGFYSAQDADSRNAAGELEEGAFFTWTPAEIEAAVGAERARAVTAYYGVTAAGNFEGRSILHAWKRLGDVARALEQDPAGLERTLEASREALYAARSRRPAPLRDEKVLAAWNGLMISALARAGFAFGEPSYTARAARAADLVLSRMRVDGRLRRVFQDGRADGPAFLEDYAFVVQGLLDLYEASSEPRWLREALALQAVLDVHYADAAGGGYYKTADDAEQLLAREKPSSDGAIPSGNSVAALNLLKLAELTGEDRYLEAALRTLSAFRRILAQQPTAVSELLLALDYHLDSSKEIVVVRPNSGGDGARLLARLRSAYVPNRILAVVAEGDELEAHAELVPLVAGKRALRGQATAYVCENRVCKFPTSDPSVFASQLEAVTPIE